MPRVAVRGASVRPWCGHLGGGVHPGGDAGKNTLFPGGERPAATHPYIHRPGHPQ